MTKKQLRKKTQELQQKPEKQLEPLASGQQMLSQVWRPDDIWSVAWQQFINGHRDWWQRYGQEPVYTLPEPVIVHLRGLRLIKDGPSRQIKPALISDKDASAENAFRTTCEHYGASTIGVWNEVPIRYDPLFPPPPSPGDLLAQLNWEGFGPIAIQQVQDLQQRSASVQHRLLGYVGYITFNRGYQAEKEALRDRWLSLGNCLPFPLVAANYPPASVPLTEEASSAHRPSTAISSFVQDIRAFLGKWQLRQLETWDLPTPQGPLVGVQAGLVSQLLGPHHLVTALPASVETPTSEYEHDATHSYQRHGAKLAGLAGKHPLSGLGGRKIHASAEENAFRLWLLENTVRRRYDAPWGLVARLTAAFGEILKVNEERIKQLRDLYGPFLPLNR